MIRLLVAAVLFSLAGRISAQINVAVSASSNPALVETPVAFLATVTPPGAYTYAWTFDDGRTGSGPAPVHTYDSKKTYQVRCVATDPLGSSGSGTLALVVIDPPELQLSPHAASLVAGGSATFTAELDKNAPAAFTVNLTSTSPGVLSHPASIVIPQGESRVTFTVTGSGAGTTTLNAALPSSLGGWSDSAAISVQGAPDLTLTPGSVTVAPGDNVNLTATISRVQPNEVPLTVSTSNPGVATVSGGTPRIPAGQLATTIEIRGVAPGIATITAALPGALGGHGATATVTVASTAPTFSLTPTNLPLVPGATGVLTLVSNPPANVNAVFTLSTSGAAVELPATATIPAGQASVPISVRGLASGTATVRARSTTFANANEATATVVVASGPALVVTLAPHAASPFVGGSVSFTATLDSNAATPVAIALSATTPGVVSLPATVTIPQGQSNAAFLVAGLAPGTTTVTATLPASLGSGADSAVITVQAAPRLILTPKSASATVGDDVVLAASIDPVQPLDVSVTVNSSNPGVASLPGGALSIRAGQTSTTFRVRGAGIGTATVTATLPAALGGGSDTASIAVLPFTPSFALSPTSLPLQAGATGSLALVLGAAGSSDVAFSLTTSDSRVASLSTETVTVPAGQTAVSIPVRAVAAGTATIRSRSTSFQSPNDATATVTVGSAPVSVLTLSPRTGSLLVGATATFTASLDASAAAPVTIALSASVSGVISIPASVVIAQGRSSVTFAVTATGGGASTLRAALPAEAGGGADTVPITVRAAPRLGLTPDSVTVPAGGDFVLTATLDPVQAADVTLNVTSSNESVASVSGGAFTVRAGQTSTSIKVRGGTAGTAVVTATLPADLGGLSTSANVTVVSSTPTFSLAPSTLPLSVGASGELAIVLSAPRNADSVFSLRFTDPGVATAASTSLTIPSGQTSASTAVHALAPGRTTVHATTASFTVANGPNEATATVVVSAAPAATLELKPDSATVAVGERLTLTVRLDPPQPAETAVALATSSPAVLSLPVTSLRVPAGQTSSSFDVRGLTPGFAAVTAQTAEASATARMTVAASCPTPDAPKLSSSVTSLAAGQSLVVSWTAGDRVLEGATFVVETSRDRFQTVATTGTTLSTSTVLLAPVSGSDYVLSIRVKTLQPCGEASPNSGILEISVAGHGASFLITKGGPSWIVPPGAAPPADSVGFRNVGGRTGRLTFSSTGGFFTFAPPFLDLAPGLEGFVTVTATGSATATPGFRSGSLVATPAPSDGAPLETRVTLSVGDEDPDASTDARTTASTYRVVFSAPRGQNPAPRRITLFVEVAPGRTGPIALAHRIEPGGAWLGLSREIGELVPPNGIVDVTLSVDRSKSTADEGPYPLRTLLWVNVTGEDEDDAALIEVIDVESPAEPVTSGDRRTVPPPAGTSFIVPSAVKSSSGVTSLVLDGWLRNQDASPVDTELWFTPDGVDGRTDPSVRKATLRVPSASTLRLSDVVGTVFGTVGTGTIEIRSTRPEALSLRTSALAISEGDVAGRNESEIPTTSYGGGIAAAEGELVIPGIRDDDSFRTNVVLTETTGFAATALLSLYDASGTPLGTKSVTVPPYSKIQVNRLPKALGVDLPLAGGSVAVKVTSGDGRLFPFATVLDNASNGFGVIRGRSARLSEANAAREGLAGLAALPTSLVIPTAARLIGSGGSRYTTSLHVVNGTAGPARLTLVYSYTDVESGASKTATASFTLPGRASLPADKADDIVASLLGVTSGSFGWMRLQGDVARVVAVAGISVPVDPSDPSKGVKTSQVDAVFEGSRDFMLAGELPHRFAGAEKSAQRKTNLILVRPGGTFTARVVVSVNGNGGESLATRTFDIAPGEYAQVTDVFGPNGLGLGDGPFQNMEITAHVVEGDGNVLAVATVNEVVSRSPAVFVLRPAGPPPTGTIGF